MLLILTVRLARRSRSLKQMHTSGISERAAKIIDTIRLRRASLYTSQKGIYSTWDEVEHSIG